MSVRKHHIRQLRRDVATCAAALFIGAWGLIYATGSTGSTTSAAARPTVTATPSTSSPWEDQPDATPMTTRQS